MHTTASEPKIVQKAGEGYDRPNADAELPIDINYQKLSEWLVQRQKLPADWHKRLQAIQAKISEAAKDLPAGLSAGLTGSAEAAVDYFRAIQIRDKLADTGERTLFGGLTGQASIWDKIVKAYENGGVFIGEAAQTMVQNVDYEIPHLQKQMTKCNQQMADADRKQSEYTRAAEAAANNYKKECAKLGITGTSVGHELKQLAQQLPALFEQLVQQLRSSELDQIIHYYQHFTQYAHGDSPNLAGQQHQTLQEHQLPNVLHLLTEIREGRTVPVSAASTAAAGDNNVVGTGGAAGGGGADLGIDWGGLIDTTAADSSTGGGGVDWSIEAGAAGTADKHATKAATGAGISWDLGDVLPATGGGDGSDAAGISWDVAVEPAADNDDAAAAAAGPSLNWDIDMSGIGVEGGGDSATNAAAPGINWDLQLDTAGVKAEEADRTAGSSSSDASASRLQHDSEYRSQLQDDLLELRAFLISRKAELNNSSSSSNLLRALAPDVVSSTDLGDATRMLTVVDQLLSSLNDSKLKQLLMINSSNRYVDRLQGNLQRKAGQESKMLAAAAETQDRKREARSTLVSLQPKLSEVVEHTRSIKKSVEVALSKQFNGRRVNVLGEINNALASTAQSAYTYSDP